ncbi:ABC transporter permease [Lapillicoccus jejuensis]|uniref:Monosaccharide ABC transporter membrane protein (CUT2 family) n=1 Tax=Lapillicoccus jejuensis TaxID=402171 RepID=A0A542DXX3_9MICO|nr:ABC transporter permease [Lapillicoccus jejuensis]TQJ07937.1 monosaccharide ABC transporter membrane protein (CUT2 family) [Lapillicoccus jejuensis]
MSTTTTPTTDERTTAAPPPTPWSSRIGVRGGDWGRWVRERGVYLALVVLVLVNVVATPNFLTLGTLQLYAVQTATVIIVSLGMALVIGTGGVDLSVGATMAVAAAVMARLFSPSDGGGSPLALAIVVALVAGTLVGVVNGLVVAVGRVQPIVATLAMLVGGRGLALVFTGGALVEMFHPFFTTVRTAQVLTIPAIFWLAILLAVVLAVVVRRTAFGFRVLAIGGNLPASRLAGVPVRRTLVGVYAVSGFLAAVAGLIVTMRLRAADPSYVGLNIELTAITAVVVGGSLLTGGKVRVLGTVAGAVLIQLLENTLTAQNVTDSIARIIEALIIIAAVFIQRPSRSAR